MEELPQLEIIADRIVVLRGQRVMLDSDLAALYGVATRRLNQQVRRNATRFPPDFVFQLSVEERDGLIWSQDATRLHRTKSAAANRSRTAIGSQKHRYPAARPLAFT